MQADPMEEWRRLTELYSEMGEIEIRDLADQINDLTPTAQQILRDEMKKRGIQAEQSTDVPGTPPGETAQIHYETHYDRDAFSDTPPGDGQHDYTWKTQLCVCNSLEEAQLRGEMLRRAGIDSWIERPGSLRYVPYDRLGEGELQILVAADQLDQARSIAARPIPQNMIDQLKDEDSAPAYTLPVCPKCGAADPTLESVEPSNNWLCESCGHTWSDSVADESTSQQPGS